MTEDFWTFFLRAKSTFCQLVRTFDVQTYKFWRLSYYTNWISRTKDTLSLYLNFYSKICRMILFPVNAITMSLKRNHPSDVWFRYVIYHEKVTRFSIGNVHHAIYVRCMRETQEKIYRFTACRWQICFLSEELTSEVVSIKYCILDICSIIVFTTRQNIL